MAQVNVQKVLLEGVLEPVLVKDCGNQRLEQCNGIILSKPKLIIYEVPFRAVLSYRSLLAILFD